MQKKSINIVSSKIEIKSESDKTFTGYASTFGNLDSYGDTIVKGAFKDTIQKHGMPRMFFNHDSSAVPLGKWISSVEDDYGLLMTGQFTTGNRMADEVHSALKHGTLNGMSIGFVMTKTGYKDTDFGREIREIHRLSEVSIVTMPADNFARIDVSSVKSFAEEIENIETIREFERFLRDAGSFSKSAAQALANRAKQLFSVRDAGESFQAAQKNDEILRRIERLKFNIKKEN